MIFRSLLFSLFLFSIANATTSKERGSAEKAELTTGKRAVWSPEMDQITCCNGGTPSIPENLVKNFTILPSDYTIEERTVDDLTLNCRDFEVRYLAQRSPELSDTETEFDNEIKLQCKCPEKSQHTLDANCRRLLSCKNKGFRSPNSPHQCICPSPFFGDRCEKFCDQGQRLKSHSGRDYCSCVPFYQNEECREVVCINGGREENGRCICPQQYLGYHCEINTNQTGHGGSRFQRFGDQSSEMFTRDISGTIFSLIMIVVLVISMYLLMKHRMQTRYLNRRSDLLGACNFPMPASMTVAGGPGSNNCLGGGRRADLMSPDDPRLFSFRQVTGTMADAAPPPYFQHRGRRGEVLPPLPSYDDATKLPSMNFRHNIPNDDSVELAEETTELSGRTQRDEQTSNDQSPSTALSPNAETIRATVRGTEMVRPASTTRPTDTGNSSTPVEENPETASINSSVSSSSSGTSEASSKPEQR